MMANSCENNQTPVVLLIEDERDLLDCFALYFEECGYRVLKAEDGREGMRQFMDHRPDLIFTDLRMPGIDGLSFIGMVKEVDPDVPVVVISGASVIADAIRAVKLGAWDYVSKPVHNLEELGVIARRALENRELRSQLAVLRDSLLHGTLVHREAFSLIITNDSGMQRIFLYVEAIAPTSHPVLITGDTGTGKELIARSIHSASRLSGNFVAVNLGGLDEHMLSDTLFGHVRGAFTGADRQREGMITKAAGGTLFLDEIGELGEVSQVKLLRLLQEREYYPLGADSPSRSSARIVAATNRNLQIMVQEGKFREDLYFRLCSHKIHVPPLCERRGDIPLLVNHFLTEAAAEFKKEVPFVPPEVLRYLATYHFPGNIRELRSMVYDAVVRHTRGPLGKESFIQAMATPSGVDHSLAVRTPFPGLSEETMPTLKQAEEFLIAKALALANGNQGIAARYLGITRQGLNKILNRKKKNLS